MGHVDDLLVLENLFFMEREVGDDNSPAQKAWDVNLEEMNDSSVPKYDLDLILNFQVMEKHSMLHRSSTSRNDTEVYAPPRVVDDFTLEIMNFSSNDAQLVANKWLHSHAQLVANKWLHSQYNYDRELICTQEQESERQIAYDGIHSSEPPRAQSSHCTELEIQQILLGSVYSKRSGNKKLWTKDEDEKLVEAVRICEERNWKKIAKVSGLMRSDIQCLQRWKQALKPGLRKGAWSSVEDDHLCYIVKRINPSDKISWKGVEKEMGGRTAKQCRERWKLTLDPNINKSPWTQEEDQKLIMLQKRYDNRWALIKDLMGTGRTENAVKIRFRILKDEIQGG